MSTDSNPVTGRAGRRGRGGYLVVVFIVILAFAGVAMGMHVLLLTSVATSSRAFDGYRQRATEAVRLERACTEAVYSMRQVSVAPPARDLPEAIQTQVARISGPGTTTRCIRLPELPVPVAFPDTQTMVDPIAGVLPEIRAELSPELALLVGSRAAVYPAAEFVFETPGVGGETNPTFHATVCTRLFGVPLSRFAIMAYDLPAEIARQTSTRLRGPQPSSPAGLVPDRDAAFVRDLQSSSGVLPYHYRHRAALSAAYQFVFSQRYVDRVAEYAGLTHFHQLDATDTTSTLVGLAKNGRQATFDLGAAGTGSYGGVALSRDALVIFTETDGYSLRLTDAAGSSSGSAILLLLLGPANPQSGALEVIFETIRRPVVVIGYNVRVRSIAAVTVEGALLLDEASAVDASARIALGHFSYWAGSATIPADTIATRPLPTAAEHLMPRVLYVASSSDRS